MTIIATGFSQTFEDNLWGSKTSTVSLTSRLACFRACVRACVRVVGPPGCCRCARECAAHPLCSPTLAAFLLRVQAAAADARVESNGIPPLPAAAPAPARQQASSGGLFGRSW